MLILACVLAAAAAALHVYIWYLESLAWTGAARQVFGTSAEEAEATKEMAYNQGFYNLFLAIVTAAGIALLALDRIGAGVTAVVAGVGSMAAAALVLGLSSPSKRRPALTQGALPALTLIAVGAWALSR